MGKQPIFNIRGEKGERGERGPQGLQGRDGNPGDVGPRGLKGDTGPQGLIGPEGPKGFKGDTGAKGDTGERGPEGPKGTKGDVGAMGNRGPQGERGEQGVQGIQGERGQQGIQGEKGSRGEVGPSGINWKGNFSSLTDYEKNDAVFYENTSWFASGDPLEGELPGLGAQNWTPLSLRGPQGSQGIQGVQGPQGLQGNQGIQGVKGDKGDQGIQGIQGVKGDQGVTGDLAPTFALGNVSGALDLSAYVNGGVFSLTLTGTLTGISLPAQSSTHQRVFELVLTQDAIGNRNVSWPAAWVGAFGLKPSLSTAPNAVDKVAIIQSSIASTEIRLVSKGIS